MQQHKARQILQSLFQGVDPSNGEELASSTVLQRADVLRALLAGVAALEQSAVRSARRALLPANVGRAWTQEEDLELTREVQAGAALEAIAANHGRTLRAIEARLEKLGLISPGDRITRNGYERGAKK